MFNPNTDPLGNGLKSRAAEYKNAWQQAADQNARDHGQLVSFGHIGPLSNPAWDGFYQAMQEKGVDRLADSSVGMKKGMFGGFDAPDTFNANFQQSAVASKPSNQLNAHPMDGFRRAIGKGF